MSGSVRSEMELAHKKMFEDCCATNYIDKAGTSGNKSKTVCKEKADKIKSILKGDVPSTGCSPSFIFWVKKTKKFELLSYEELDLRDVLCLPAKVMVGINNYNHYNYI